MTRTHRIGLGCLSLLILFAGLVFIGGQFLTREFRERTALLQPLLATNASLSVVTQHAGYFNVCRRGTPDWDQVIGQYKRGSKWDHHIAEKMERASAVGHISTIDMQTWIFLDSLDRLVDFELGTQ